MENTTIKIKPLSINECFQGRRFKTIDYLIYEKTIWWLLPKLKIPKGKLKVYLEFGLSSKPADIDNPVKPMVDILQKKYQFNDKQIYHMDLTKIDVKKGEEFISFLITAL